MVAGSHRHAASRVGKIAVDSDELLCGFRSVS